MPRTKNALRVLIINGPNLNLLGKREPALYGNRSFDNFIRELKGLYPDVIFEYFQSNVEGELINKLHEAGFPGKSGSDAILLNAGGYTHTSVAIADAVAAIRTPVIEVHITNIYSREEFRQKSLLSPHCLGVISGFGLDSYRLAVEEVIRKRSIFAR